MAMVLAEPTPALAVQSEEPWLIVPGVNVGPITAKTSEADLTRIYGKSNIMSEELPLPDHCCEPGTVIYRDDPSKTIKITWKDKNRRQFPGLIIISGQKKSLWRTTQGISIGTTLKELERINGRPFVLAGWGWDYGGYVRSWEQGKLEKEFNRNGDVALLLYQPEGKIVSEKEYESVMGSIGFPSENKVMQQLNPIVTAIFVSFK